MSAWRAGHRDAAGYTLVELLVTMMILAIVGAGTFAVVRTATQTERFTQELHEVMADGRISLSRIRKELRAARRVYEDSTGTVLRIWVDQDQDGLQQTAEQVTYETRLVTGATDRWELHRYTAASGSAASRVIARTLVDPAPFAYDVAPPDSSAVVVTLDLDVTSGGGPDTLELSAEVRLRNAT